MAFDRADLVRKRRLREVQAFGRCRERSRFRNRHEGAKVPQLDHRSSFAGARDTATMKA